MFTLPPLPPVDYEIKEVTDNLQSCQEFSPDAPPRVTLPSIAKFCSPIENDDIQPGEYRILDAPSKIIDKWADRARAEWVDPPNKNAKFMHEMFQKYNVIVDPDYDPRFKAQSPIFSRSFKYELDCIEVKRREKLAAKTQREFQELNDIQRAREIKKIKARPPSVEVIACGHKPPFWWSFDGVHETKEGGREEILGQSTKIDQTYLRWREKPGLWSKDQKDSCDRKLELLLVGQPFHNEACNWYYQNYPPPNLQFKPEKFS